MTTIKPAAWMPISVPRLVCAVVLASLDPDTHEFGLLMAKYRGGTATPLSPPRAGARGDACHPAADECPPVDGDVASSETVGAHGGGVRTVPGSPSSSELAAVGNGQNRSRLIRTSFI